MGNSSISKLSDLQVSNNKLAHSMFQKSSLHAKDLEDHHMQKLGVLWGVFFFWGGAHPKDLGGPN